VNWLTPLAGLILAAAVIPPLIVLYFLKLRRRPQAIACTLLWKRAVQDLRANAPFQRLRSSLLLFLQLLALILLALSIMQPQLQAGRPKGGRIVLLIDNSTSMTATDIEDGRSRLDEAKRLAKERVEALYGGGLFGRGPDETMIVAFSDRAEVSSRFSNSRPELLNAIDRIQPTHGETRLDEALKLARAYTTNVVDPASGEARAIGEPPMLEIFSDGRISDLTEQVLRGERALFHRVGSTDADNLAIGTVSVERPYDRPTAVEVFTSLLNFNREAVKCDVQLSVDAVTLAVQEIEIPGGTEEASTGTFVPGQKNLVFTPFEQPRGAVIELAALRSDDLAADNVSRVVVAPPKQLRVALVAPKSFLIRTVLEGLSLRGLEILTEDQYGRLARGARLEAYDVIVFDNYAPPPDLMPPARYLTFGLTPPVEGLNEFGTTDAQIVLNVRDEHPALRFVGLDPLFINKCRLLQPADDVQVLAEGSQGPVIVAVARGPMQLIHVTFDPLQSDWPFQRSFVTFIFNAIEHLGHVGEGLTTRGFKPGEALTARLPASATGIELRAPDGSVHKLNAANPTMFTWGPVRLSGLYLLSWKSPEEAGGSQQRAMAVNIVSEREGRISAVEDLRIGREDAVIVSGEGGAYMPLWPYALGACLALLMFEWWVYHRKAYI
jgi:hypothetical protein